MTNASASIQINNLTYTQPRSDKPCFHNLTLTLRHCKMGLIGRNGIGKTTLLQLIVGELTPDKGSISRNVEIAYYPQQHIHLHHQSIAKIFACEEKIAALSRVHNNCMHENDLHLIGDDWLCEENIKKQLAKMELQNINLLQPLGSLSGGEQTRVLLAKVLFGSEPFCILDEPTNNLDQSTRHLLYKKIMESNKSFLIVSHDRVLLNKMDKMIELTSLGINFYGGHYDFYIQQKEIEVAAIAQHLADAKKQMHRAQKTVQRNLEKHAERIAHGKLLRRDGSQPKILMDKMKDNSTRSLGELSTRHEHMLEKAHENLATAKAKLEIFDTIHLDLPKTAVPNSKIIIDIANVNFAYQTPLIQNFNFNLTGAKRVALQGDNGSGKTTLVKLILGKLFPQTGKIYVGTNRICYLDQHGHLLQKNISLLENFFLFNPDAKINDAYASLAKFLFKNTCTQKMVGELSGGEKIRAALACTLLSPLPPQLLILDEPTNHLDLESIANIEMALKHYQGAMLIISHDEVFLQNIAVATFIKAPFIN